jgi:hypothetical protein
VSAAYGVDTNWYADSGVTNHITSNLEKLTFHEKYWGRDHVHTTNGTGMFIKNIGHTMLHSPVRSIHLKMFFMFQLLKNPLLPFIA